MPLPPTHGTTGTATDVGAGMQGAGDAHVRGATEEVVVVVDAVLEEEIVVAKKEEPSVVDKIKKILKWRRW